MKRIPRNFNHDGFTFRQLLREGQVILFEKHKPQHNSPTFEVVVTRISPACRLFGYDYPEREVMPTAEDWGNRGWTYQDRESAKKRFFEVCDRVRKGNSSPIGTAVSAFTSAADSGTAEPRL